MANSPDFISDADMNTAPDFIPDTPAVTGPEISASEAFAVGTGAGLTFDFDDELAGAFGAAKSALTAGDQTAFADNYRKFKDAYQAHKDEAQKQHMLAYLSGNIAGAVAPSFIPVVGELGAVETLYGAGQMLKEGATAAKVGNTARAAMATQGVLGAVGRVDNITHPKEALDEFTNDMLTQTAFVGTGSLLATGAKKVFGGVQRAATDHTVRVIAESLSESKAADTAKAAIQEFAPAETAMFNTAHYADEVTPAVFHSLDQPDKQALIDKAMSRYSPEAQHAILDTNGELQQHLFNKQLDSTIAELEKFAPAKTPAEKVEQRLSALETVTAGIDTDAGYLINRAAADLGMSGPEYSAYSLLRRGTKEFQEKMDKFGGVKNYLKQNGPEELRARFDMMRQATETLEQGGREEIPLGRKRGVIDKVAMFFSDGREVLTALQDHHNIDLVPIIDNLSRGYNKLNMQRVALQAELSKSGGLDEMLTALRGTASHDEWLTTLADIKEPKAFQSALAKLSPEQQAAVGELRRITELFAESFGVLEKTKDPLYLPVQLRDQRYIHKDMYKYTNTVKAMFGVGIDQIDDNQFRKMLRSPELQPFYNAVSFLSDTKPQTAQEFYAAFSSLNSQHGMAVSLASKAGPLMRRVPGADIPDFLREKNAGALLRKYVVSVGRHRYLGGQIDALDEASRVLRGRGDLTGGDYVNRLAQDVKGIPRDSVGFLIPRAMGAISAGFDKLAVDAPTDGMKAFYKNMGTAPEVLYGMINNVYPYYLGMRPSVIVRNLTQPMLMTVPHLGSDPYAAKLMIGAYADLARDMKNGTSVLAEMRAKGLMPPEHSVEFYEAMSKRPVQQTGVRKAIDTAGNFLNEQVMKPFEGTEILNRVVTYKMGQRILRDAAAGHPSALRVIERSMPIRQAREVSQHIAAKNWLEAENLITNDLLAKTQFNYNKANASEFARYMGPVFSMFTKWPSSMLGDIYSTTSNKRIPIQDKAKKLALKYVAPYLMLMAADTAWNERDPDNEWTNYMIGKGKLTGMAPIMSLASLSPTNIGTPPLLDTAGKLSKAVVAGGAALYAGDEVRPAIFDAMNGIAPFLPGGTIHGVMADWIKLMQIDQFSSIRRK